MPPVSAPALHGADAERFDCRSKADTAANGPLSCDADAAGFDPIAYINEPRWQSSRLGLERISALLERMGRPQDRCRFVHVAGTNGKGSACAYLASILQAAGYRTGLFTSPYIVRFEERIRVDGRDISKSDLVRTTLFVREHAEALAAETGDHPTEFELMCAVALQHFVDNGCDIAVVEVGLGGRLDSTNVIPAPEVCVIARIAYDHTDLLGSTLAAIAGEKAGIIKPGSAVVSWPQDDAGAAEAIERVAASCGAPVVVPDLSQLEYVPVDERGLRRFSYRGRAYETCLLGSYQPANAALAVESALALRARGWDVSDDAIERGVRAARWPGRFEVLDGCARGCARVVVDGGHNPQGARVLMDSLEDVFPGEKSVFLIGVLADKDYRAMVAAALPHARAFVCVEPPNPRALSASDLAAAVRDALAARATAETDVAVQVADGMDDAAARALALAGDGGLICAFGSLYSLAAVKAAFGCGPDATSKSLSAAKNRDCV